MSEEQELPDAGNEYESEPSAQPVMNWNINDQRIAELKEEIGDVDAYANLDHAKKSKRLLTKMRTTLAEAHKETKAEALAFGKKCDTEKNRLLVLIGEVEDPITKDLTDIKEKAEREEAARVEAIELKVIAIQLLAEDRHELNLDQLAIRVSDLETWVIDEEVFQEFTDRATLTRDEVAMKLKMSVQKESDRVEQERKQAEVEAENQKLRDQIAEQTAKAEAEAEERRLAEQAEAEEQRKKDAEAARIQREKDDAEAAERKAEQDKRDEEQAAAQKVIDDENDRLAQVAAEEEERLQREQDEAIAALQAPDKEKLLGYAKQISEIARNKPVVQSVAGMEILMDARDELMTVAERVVHQAEEL